jgi:hypothetical protein
VAAKNGKGVKIKILLLTTAAAAAAAAAAAVQVQLAAPSFFPRNRTRSGNEKLSILRTKYIDHFMLLQSGFFPSLFIPVSSSLI